MTVKTPYMVCACVSVGDVVGGGVKINICGALPHLSLENTLLYCTKQLMAVGGGSKHTASMEPVKWFPFQSPQLLTHTQTHTCSLICKQTQTQA